jgi:hypothetical protein
MPTPQENLKSARAKAEAGRATEMTPDEMDAFREWSKTKKEEHEEAVDKKRTEARKIFSQKEKDIYVFMKTKWNALDARGEFDADKHTEPVVKEASERFGVSEQQAKDIYAAVAGAGETD